MVSSLAYYLFIHSLLFKQKKNVKINMFNYGLINMLKYFFMFALCCGFSKMQAIGRIFDHVFIAVISFLSHICRCKIHGVPAFLKDIIEYEFN